MPCKPGIGGIAGLASAALLARDGHQVTLLEARRELGGRAGTWQRRGFRFDTGPSWYLMPEVFEHFFSLLGTSVEAELDLAVLDPSYRVFFEGHPQPVDLRPDRAHNRALFESLEPGAGARFDAYLRSADDTYDVALRHFLYNSFDSPSTLLHPDVVRRTPRLGRLLTRSLRSHVAASFSDDRIRRLLGYPAVFLGSSPGRAPSMYHLMSRLDLGDRVRCNEHRDLSHGGHRRGDEHHDRQRQRAVKTEPAPTDADVGREAEQGVAEPRVTHGEYRQHQARRRVEEHARERHASGNIDQQDKPSTIKLP